MTSSPQGKYWCFTYNNPLPIDEVNSLLVAASPSYYYFAEEVGESGTRHFQGYIEFAKLKRLSQLKKISKAIHWERRQGSQQQAIDYCKKGPCLVFSEFGSPSETHQGARSDLSRGIELLREGGITRVAQEAPELYVRNHRGLLALELELKPSIKHVPIVTLAFGPPGVGKTRRFYESATDSRWANNVDGTGLWFDGYHSQSYALLDDFSGRGSHYTLANLLRLLDRYDLRVPVKGGHVWWNPEYIFITSNYHPRDWYDYGSREQQWRALVRRFHLVIWWTSPEADDPIELEPESDRWEHFWDGPQLAQLGLDRQSGKLISNAPADYYLW